MGVECERSEGTLRFRTWGATSIELPLELPLIDTRKGTKLGRQGIKNSYFVSLRYLLYMQG